MSYRQVNLLRGWREFIEVYVQPSPNRPSTYKQRPSSGKDKRTNAAGSPDSGGSFLRRDSRDSWESSDDDVPGTPPSFSHSQSQLSGESLLT